MNAVRALGLAAFVLAACEDAGRSVRPALNPHGTAALPSISDAGHGGNSRFAFLPPMVPAIEHADPFDAGLSPVVEICEINAGECGRAIATYTTLTGPGAETVRVEASEGLYIVNWHTDQFDLADGIPYRVTVSVAGSPVGYAEVVVFRDVKQVKALATGEYVGLIDGRMLPIKFRAAVGMVVDVAITEFPASVEVGSTVDLDATVRDGHGQPVADRPASWSSSDPSVAAVDADGVVTAVAPGTATITAAADGQRTSVAVTVVPRPDVSPISIAAGARHTCSVVRNVTECWGSNQYYQIGIGLSTERCRASGLCLDQPRAVAGGVTFAKIAAGNDHTCALTPEGGAYCWGYNGHTQVLGDGNSAIGEVNVPSRVAIGEPLNTIVAGATHSCGIGESGAAYCWGANDDGQLGDGKQQFRRVVRVAGGMTFTAIAAGERHTCAVSSDGVAYCWGWNVDGQVGDASTTSRSTPVRVAGDLRFRAISAGESHTCAVTTDGHAYCWGNNKYGKLGSDPGGTLGSNPDGVSQSVPRAVVGGLRFATVSAGYFHTTCGITVEGPAYCWGWNAFGQLGMGREAEPYFSVNPLAVAGGISFVQVSVGGQHACGVTAGRQRYCWGTNVLGQVGIGPFSGSSPAPVLVASP